jgi:hypothetical protein
LLAITPLWTVSRVHFLDYDATAAEAEKASRVGRGALAAGGGFRNFGPWAVLDGRRCTGGTFFAHWTLPYHHHRLNLRKFKLPANQYLAKDGNLDRSKSKQKSSTQNHGSVHIPRKTLLR